MEISLSGTVSFEEGTALVSTWLVALTRVSPRALLPGGRKEGKTRTDRKHARRGKESLWQETARTACEEAKLIAIVIVERKASQSPAKTLNCGREKQKTLRRAKQLHWSCARGTWRPKLRHPSPNSLVQDLLSGDQKKKERSPQSISLLHRINRSAQDRRLVRIFALVAGHGSVRCKPFLSPKILKMRENVPDPHVEILWRAKDGRVASFWAPNTKWSQYPYRLQNKVNYCLMQKMKIHANINQIFFLKRKFIDIFKFL